MTKRFNKVIVWGHKLLDPASSNTFAFIHDSWTKAFRHLGEDVLWLDNNDNTQGMQFDNCLFLTEGQVDQNIPINASCKYVVHNCNLGKYQGILSNVLNLQVYTHDCLTRKVQPVNLAEFCYYQPEPDFSREDHGCDNRTLYQPWATNLLPDEIDVEKLVQAEPKRQNKVFWVGSIMGGPHRNDDKILELSEALKGHSVGFVHAKLTNDLQPRAISESFIAPAIQGVWQVKKGYIPCRVFKNVSYGRMTGTNSATVSNLFDGNLIYDESIKEVVDKSVLWEQNPNKKQLETVVRLVKEKHTFINRIKNILSVL